MTTSGFGRINRRRFVASSALGGATVLTAGPLVRGATGPSLPAALMAQDDSADVPMYRGNAARTGEMPGPGPDSSNGVEVIWQFSTAENSIDATAVVDGIVYAGSNEGVLHAVNANDGTERWRFTAEAHFQFAAVMDGVVYVGSDEGNLYALSAEDGTERWRFTITDDGIGGPAVANGIVYAASYRGILYAVSAEDGTEHWRFTTTGDYMYSPAVVNGVAYAGTDGGILYAINAADGIERWRFTTSPDVSISWPAVVDGVVYAGSLGIGLFALNADDGAERWRFNPTNEEIGGPIVVDGLIYAGGDSGSLYAVNADDGSERWRFAFNTESSVFPWAVVDGVVYATSDGNLYAIGARVPRLGIGGTARVTETTSLRGGPAPTAVERAEIEPDTVVTITGESVITGDVTWWPVTVDETGDQGWVEASKLEPLTSGPEPTATP